MYWISKKLAALFFSTIGIRIVRLIDRIASIKRRISYEIVLPWWMY